MSSLLKNLLFLFIGCWILSVFLRDKLPGKDDVLPPLLKEPNQTETTKAPFFVTAKDETYRVAPVYNYELYGLVVSNHRSAAFADRSHTKSNDYLNIEDVCVVYGKNISTEVYKRMKFSHGDWSCWGDFNGSAQQQWDVARDFSNHYLSNNHILTEDPNLAQQVLATRPGDQIYFRGYLVNYTNHKRWEGFYRNSSITRDDEGDGACEIVYVTDYKILKEGNIVWRFLGKFAQVMVIVVFISLFLDSFMQSRRMLRG